MIKNWIPFSFNSLRRLLIKKTTPKTTAVNESTSIPHLSAREACSMKLSITARKNISNSTSQADLQYFVTKFQNINVSDTADIIHIALFNPNGGLGKINWKTHKTISTADKKG